MSTRHLGPQFTRSSSSRFVQILRIFEDEGSIKLLRLFTLKPQKTLMFKVRTREVILSLFDDPFPSLWTCLQIEIILSSQLIFIRRYVSTYIEYNFHLLCVYQVYHENFTGLSAVWTSKKENSGLWTFCEDN